MWQILLYVQSRILFFAWNKSHGHSNKDYTWSTISFQNFRPISPHSVDRDCMYSTTVGSEDRLCDLYVVPPTNLTLVVRANAERRIDGSCQWHACSQSSGKERRNHNKSTTTSTAKAIFSSLSKLKLNPRRPFLVALEWDKCHLHPVSS
jgi:hypothetical protein